MGTKGIRAGNAWANLGGHRDERGGRGDSQQGHRDRGGHGEKNGGYGVNSKRIWDGAQGNETGGTQGWGGGMGTGGVCTKVGGTWPELGRPRDHPGGCGDGTEDAEGQRWGFPELSWGMEG